MKRKSTKFLWIGSVVLLAAILIVALKWLHSANKIAIAEAHMRSIMQSMILYAGDNQDQFPPVLYLVANSNLLPETLLDPRLPAPPKVSPSPAATQADLRFDFYFAGMDASNTMDSATIVLYDKGQAGPTRLIAFGDGHVGQFKSGSPELKAAVRTANQLRKGQPQLPEDLLGPPR